MASHARIRVVERGGVLAARGTADPSGDPGFAQKVSVQPDLLGNRRFCPKTLERASDRNRLQL